MSEFEEVFDHPDNKGQYLTKQELEEYNNKKKLAVNEGMQELTISNDLIEDMLSSDKSHPGSWVILNEKQPIVEDTTNYNDNVKPSGNDDNVNNVCTNNLVWLDEFDLFTSHPACIRVVEKDIKQASALKAKGNEYYKQKFFDTAIKYYTRAISYCPLTKEHSYSRAVFYSNRAACYMSMTEYDRAIEDCSTALSFEPTYVKTILRRCKAYEAIDQLEDAVADIDRIVDIDKGNRTFLMEQHRLQTKLKEKQEAMKKEMMDKLKGLGNTILGKFGMSLDNFKFNQKDDGTYSVNFQQ